MSMLLRTALVAVVGLSASAFILAAKPDKPKLDGQHQITAGERDGKPLTEADFKGCTFRFTGDKVVAANKDGTEFLSGDYTLNCDKTPCQIDIKLTGGSDKGKVLHGLVDKKDKEIHIVYAGPGGDRPTEFKTKQNQAMYTLKSEK